MTEDITFTALRLFPNFKPKSILVANYKIYENLNKSILTNVHQEV